MFRGLALLAVCILLSGCAAVLPMSSSFSSLLDGRAPSDVHEQTGVNLSQANFVLVKTNVMGWSRGFSLLGLITIVPPTVSQATSRMYGSAQMRLGGAQTMANLIVERSSSYWILFGIPKVEVHADVVEFRPLATEGQSHANPTE